MDIPLLLANLQLGLAAALTPENLFYCLLGSAMGTFLGMVPGVGALAALSMLFPITYQVGPDTALIMLAGMYYGTSYGGSIASILLNVPGTPSSAIVCLDGYPMAQQGRAGVALFMTAIASFVAINIGIVIMMLISPLVATFALSFGAPEYFALMTMGLVLSAVIIRGSALSGLAMILLGMLAASIGTDIYSGQQRYTFGIVDLYDGVLLIAVAIGLFGVGEVITTLREASARSTEGFARVTLRSMIPQRDDIRRSTGPILRGSGVGAFFGALPGAGSLISSVVSYGIEKNLAKDPERFGTGAIEGVVAPEAANSSSDPTAFIPTLTLGVPGSAAMALMLGVLMVHGINPGPRMIEANPDLFWGLVVSFWIANLILLVLNVPLIGIWVSILRIPYRMLYPVIIVFICLGVYSVGSNPFDIFMVAAFGIAGYVLRACGFSVAPMILGFVLGPMIEENFRRAMLMARGDPMIFLERPISASLLALTVAALAWTLLRNRRREGRIAPHAALERG